MSYPINPLDEFRTYSYHNILLAAHTTEGLRPFISANPDLDTAALNAIISTQQGEVIKVGNSSDAYLVIDSRRTSNFSIREFNYTVLPGVGAPSQTHMIQSIVNMIIVDPDGIVFINFLKYLIDEKMKSDLFGIYFLLKTIFVGHKQDGSTEVISTSAIPLMLRDLEFDVTFKEGTYTCSFIPVSQNIGSMVQEFSRVKDVSSLISSDDKLGSVITNFENRLNQSYRKWYKDLNISLKKYGESEVKETKNEKTGRLIQVMITIPEKWKSFKFSSGFNKELERNFKKELELRTKTQAEKLAAEKEEFNKSVKEIAAKGNETEAEIKQRLNKQFISFAPMLNVYDVLGEIFKLSPDISKMADKKAIKNDSITLFKTVSSVTSNSEIILIHFDVIEYTVPNITLKTESGINKNWFVETPDGKKIPKNSIEFDYIYTGKNTDIIDFSLKMSKAQLLLMSTSKFGSSSHRIVSNQKTQSKNPETLEKNNIAFIRENDPITFPLETIDNKTNFSYMPEKNNISEQLRNQESRNEWLQNVAKLHQMSSLSTKVNIRGNPNLMSKFVVDTIFEHRINENIKIQEKVALGTFVDNTIVGSQAEWESQKEKYRTELDTYFRDNVDKELQGVLQDDNTINGPKAFAHPLFIKINVFAPNSLSFGQTTKKLDESDNRDYIQFWFDGYYIVSQLENKFADGLFTQDIMLHAYEVYGPTISTESGGTKEVTENSTIQNSSSDATPPISPNSNKSSKDKPYDYSDYYTPNRYRQAPKSTDGVNKEFKPLSNEQKDRVQKARKVRGEKPASPDQLAALSVNENTIGV